VIAKPIHNQNLSCLANYQATNKQEEEHNKNTRLKKPMYNKPALKLC